MRRLATFVLCVAVGAPAFGNGQGSAGPQALLLAQARGGAAGQHGNPHPNQKPKPKAGEVLRRYLHMPAPQQQKALARDPQFQKLPPKQQQQLQQRLQQLNSMPPQKQEHVLNRMEQFEELTPEQRQQARALQQQVQAMPPDRRQQMRIALRNLRQMPPQEQQQVLNSDQFKSKFSDGERGVLNGMLQLPIGQGNNAQPAAAQPTAAPH